MTYERPNVDGLLIAQMRTICAQLCVGLDPHDAHEAGQRLEHLLRVFSLDTPQPGWLHRGKPNLRIVTPGPEGDKAA